MDLHSFDNLSSTDTSSNSPDTQFHPQPHRSAWIAWLAILFTVIVILCLPYILHKEEVADPSTAVFEIQARSLVGASTIASQEVETRKRDINLVFNKGSVRQRMMGAVLLGELVGPQEAEEALGELETNIEKGTLHAQDDDKKCLQLLQRIQAALIAKTPLSEAISDDDLQAGRSLVSRRLGWVGELAFLPPGSPDLVGRNRLIDNARRTIFVIMSAVPLAILAATCGLALQILWWVFAATGRLSSGIAPLRGNGAIYAETFAVWMILFMALNIGMISLPLPKWGLVLVLIPQIGSLAALAWPVFRGLRWDDVRQDIGLTFGPKGWAAPFVGLGTYLSALPVVGVAALVTFLMMAVANQLAGAEDSAAAPAHPIVESIMRGNWSIRFQLLFVAMFAAVPEEIMFRGVLYRHLRESGKRLGYVGSVAFAALISSFVFAVIHPQGVFGIPILMSLAMVFALVREWRGSLIPCMIAHALVNAGTCTLLFLIAD